MGRRRANPLDDALAELARVPPREHTQVRAALAARLQQAGHAEAAAEMRRRRAPTIPVWAVNRIALDEPELVARLVAAADRLRTTQVGRGRQAGDLASATAAHRQALSALIARARGVLAKAGVRASPGVLQRIQGTASAAAAAPAQHAALEAGALTRELSAPGFEAVGALGVAPASGRRAAAPSRDDAEARRRAAPAPRAAGEPRRRPAEPRRQVAEQAARRSAADERRAARRAAAEEARARRGAEKAEQAEQKAKEREARATRIAERERALEAAARAVDDARAQSTRAATALAEATAAHRRAGRDLAAARRAR